MGQWSLVWGLHTPGKNSFKDIISWILTSHVILSLELSPLELVLGLAVFLSLPPC